MSGYFFCPYNEGQCFIINILQNIYFLCRKSQMKLKNELIWRHFELNQAEMKFVLSSFQQFETAHFNFLGEFVLAPKHLWATIGA